MAESDHHALKAKDIVEDVSICVRILFLSGGLNVVPGKLLIILW